jgi:cytochrome c oxidase subunit II
MIGLGLSSTFLSWLPLADRDATYWLPQQASTIAPKVDGLFYVILYICAFFFALIMGCMVLFIILYRKRAGHKEQPSPSHNSMLEIVWSVIPLLLVVVIFWISFKAYMFIQVPPSDAYQVKVDAHKWQWGFTYPNGYWDPELHVPADKAVVLTMTSDDVLHAMFIPDFRVKQDVVPGRYTRVWFEADKTGEHQIYCAEYCGEKHSQMWSKVTVHEAGDFEKWLAKASDPFADKSKTPAQVGEKIFKQRGCVQCHSIEGKSGTGPHLNGIFGHSVKLTSGETVIAEENYIRQSVLDPASQVVAGFQPVMPSFQGRLKDKEIDAVIEYLKTLK